VTPFVQDADFTLWIGDLSDVLPTLSDGSVDAVVTSPPYLDARPEYAGPRDFEYPMIFSELARVCAGGMLWNVGRLWRGGIEQMWWLELIRAAAISGWEHWDTGLWIKPNANPLQGRVFVNSHEYVLVFGRDGVRFNEDAIRTPYKPSSLARYKRPFKANAGVKGYDRPLHRRTDIPVDNRGARPRSYVEIVTGTEKGNPHPAPMALGLAEHLVSLACWPGQTILDPFAGSGTTAIAARKHGRSCVAIEKDEGYARLAADRLSQLSLLAEAAS